MIEGLQNEIKELLNNNKEFMMKLINIISEQEELYFKKEQDYVNLERLAETNNYKCTKFEKENLILKEEKKMLELKLKVLEESLGKSYERIMFLEKEFEKSLDKELQSEETKAEDLEGKNNENIEGGESEITVDEDIFDNKDELFDKISQSIKQKRYRKIDILFNKNIDLIKNCNEDFDKNEILILSYLAVKNDNIVSLMKSIPDLNVFIRSENKMAKAIRLLRDEKDAPYGYADTMCYDKYLLDDKEVFNELDNNTLRYIKNLGEDMSYRYYEDYKLLGKNYTHQNYQEMKGFIKLNGKYQVVKVLKKRSGRNVNEIFIAKDEIIKYTSKRKR